MDVVLDTNVLLRILISQGNILDLFFHPFLFIYTPAKIVEEFERNKEDILSRSKITNKEFKLLADLLFSNLIISTRDEYKSLLPNALLLLGEHKKDEDFVALALLKKCKIWSYEDRLFKIGMAISTKELSKELE